MKITRGITMHGFAFNVSTDLSMFEGIVPCGIEGRWVTSVEAETGGAPPVEEVAALAANHLVEVFGSSLSWSRLGPAGAAASAYSTASIHEDANATMLDCSMGAAPTRAPTS